MTLEFPSIHYYTAAVYFLVHVFTPLGLSLEECMVLPFCFPKRECPFKPPCPSMLWCVRGGTCFPHPHYKHHWYLQVDIFSYIYQPFVLLLCISSVCALCPVFSIGLFSFFIHLLVFYVLCNNLLSVLCSNTHTLTSGFSPCLKMCFAIQ